MKKPGIEDAKDTGESQYYVSRQEVEMNKRRLVPQSKSTNQD